VIQKGKIKYTKLVIAPVRDTCSCEVWHVAKRSHGFACW